MTHAAERPWELPEDPQALAQVRALSHVRALTDLFGRRPDLTGVYSPADLTKEAVLWSA
ncbi:hypothetical protein [Nocardioides conyzicola]|uniref:Uncharacterized protein n=1 Tax=Nocardioides conyzicola TaxID=1651781 RepID=A0ABP8XD83_9ACTN